MMHQPNGVNPNINNKVTMYKVSTEDNKNIIGLGFIWTTIELDIVWVK